MSRAIELMYEVADKNKSDPMNNQKDMVTLTVNELEAFYQAIRREACAWQREQDATGDEMKTREEAAAFIEQQLLWKREPTHDKLGANHYGRQELRDLLDYIYCGPPKNDAERIDAPRAGCWMHGYK